MALASSGITVSAVKTALGTSNTNVGGLCTNSSINHWSRWKPIHSTANTLTWQILKDSNFGINILQANNPSTLFTNVKNNGNKGYIYNNPKGGSNSPYRLGDFRNYDHYANIPLECTYQNNDKVNIGGVTSTNKDSYKRPIEGIQSAGDDLSDGIDTDIKYIGINDIYPTSDYTLRRGALITDGTNTYWSTDYIPWAESNWQKFKGKTVTVFEFMTNTKNNLENIYTASAEDRFYALPDPIRTISVTNSVPAGSKTVWVNAECTFAGTLTTRINYEVTFSSVGETYRGGTLTNVHIVYAKDNKGLNPIASKKLADSITLGSEETSETYIGFLNNTPELLNGYILIYWNNSIQHTTMVMQEVGPQSEEGETE